MTNLSSKVMAEIRQKKITPRPRAFFIGVGLALIALSVGLLAVAGISVAAMVLGFVEAPWREATRFPGGYAGLIWHHVGLVFIVGAGVFGLLAAVTTRYIGRGYLLPPFLVGAGGVVLVTLIGVVLLTYMTPENIRLKALPQFSYENIAKLHQPENGRVIGIITQEEENTLLLPLTGEEDIQLMLLNTKVPLMPGPFMVFGESIESNVFAVTDIQPLWKARRKK